MKNSYPIIGILSLLSLASNLPASEAGFPDLSGDYLGQPPPRATPVVFARGIVSTDDLEHSAPDESYVLFSSNRRDPNHDAGDLYISNHLPDGSWTEPVSLGTPVNSPRQERFPMLSPDGKYLFFTRPTPGHDQDVYWVDAATIPALRSTTRPPQENPK